MMPLHYDRGTWLKVIPFTLVGGIILLLGGSIHSGALTLLAIFLDFGSFESFCYDLKDYVVLGLCRNSMGVQRGYGGDLY